MLTSNDVCVHYRVCLLYTLTHPHICPFKKFLGGVGVYLNMHVYIRNSKVKVYTKQIEYQQTNKKKCTAKMRGKNRHKNPQMTGKIPVRF